jgi:magnesium transporter
MPDPASPNPCPTSPEAHAGAPAVAADEPLVHVIAYSDEGCDEQKIGDRIDYLEEELVANPKPEKLDLMHGLKREMLFLRNSVWPLREVIGSLERGESRLIQPATEVYLRDVHDHTIQVIETIETYRDMLSGMLDIYLSSVSNRLNEVMKVLTVISTIFMPLTFIAGVYGMNFRHMPEIGWRWGYAVVWGVMLLVALLMLHYFRRRKWL